MAGGNDDEAGRKDRAGKPGPAATPEAGGAGAGAGSIWDIPEADDPWATGEAGRGDDGALDGPAPGPTAAEGPGEAAPSPPPKQAPGGNPPTTRDAEGRASAASPDNAPNRQQAAPEPTGQDIAGSPAPDHGTGSLPPPLADRTLLSTPPGQGAAGEAAPEAATGSAAEGLSARPAGNPVLPVSPHRPAPGDATRLAPAGAVPGTESAPATPSAGDGTGHGVGPGGEASDRTRISAPPRPMPPPGPAPGLPPGLAAAPAVAGVALPRSTGFEATRLALPPHALPTETAAWPVPEQQAPQPAPQPEPAPRPKARPQILLPRRRRNYSFSLIAFADAMFQLLIFFMLASNLSSFSLLTISQGSGPGATPGAAQAATPPTAGPGQTAIWTLSRDGVTAGGQRFELAQIARLAEGARAAGTGQVLLVTRGGAEVQGVVQVLEALARNGIASVQIAAPQPAQGGTP